MILASRKRNYGRGALALAFSMAASFLLFAAERPVAAQKPESAPEILHTPVGTTEVGVLAGASYRIDIPNDWNHSLVVYYHGYAMHGVSYHIAERLDGQQLPMFERHYAVAQSAYSEPGWALPQAYPETEQLRRYFSHAYGVPRETYVAGGSMGGALTMVTLELNPKPYLGGLDLCGAVGPTSESFERRFALRAAFDYYFPGLMPPLVPSPLAFEDTATVRGKINDALKANPTAATALRNLMELHTDQGVATDIAYFTFVITDMQHRAGGNPFDNRNYIYTGTSPTSTTGDYALNDGVRRYPADPKARDYLFRHYTPNGHLTKPMLAVHTIYDPTIPATTLSLYDHMVQGAGFGENLVQQYVHREGHCSITPDEVGHAFDELVEWTHHGGRPTPGLLH
jgi:pimeloyl-ACP methyl ester carboxylesterase